MVTKKTERKSHLSLVPRNEDYITFVQQHSEDITAHLKEWYFDETKTKTWLELKQPKITLIDDAKAESIRREERRILADLVDDIATGDGSTLQRKSVVKAGLDVADIVDEYCDVGIGENLARQVKENLQTEGTVELNKFIKNKLKFTGEMPDKPNLPAQ